ncbi:MAG: hypothetical protein ACOX23_09425 [Peptococcia bacterium]
MEVRILDQSGYITSSFEFGTTTVVTGTVTERGRKTCPLPEGTWCGHSHYHTDSCYEQVERDVTEDITNNKDLRCTLNNLYPGAWVVLEVVVKNAGPIPVRFKDVKLTGVGGTDIGNLRCELVSDDANSAAIEPNATKAFKVRVSVTDEREGITMIPRQVGYL